jgi:hypothetical protein
MHNNVTFIPITTKRLGKQVPTVNTPQQYVVHAAKFIMRWCDKHASKI